MLPAKMMTPTMNGKVPASTPALDQPMPLSKLEIKTAAPNAPVLPAVAVSRLRREIIDPRLVGDEPAFLGGDVVGPRDVVSDELAERIAGGESVGLRGALAFFLPSRGVLN